MIYCLLLALYMCWVQAMDTKTQFQVVYLPSYETSQNLDAIQLAVLVNDKRYLLDNSQSADSLIYAGAIPLETTTYQYVVINKEGQEIEREPFDRVLNEGPSLDWFSRPNTAVSSAYTLPLVQFTQTPSQTAYHYSGEDVHPTHEIPALHIHANPDSLKKLYVDLLQDATVTANISRISGKTSRLFKKLSYSIKIAKAADSKALEGFRRFKLRSCATDPSYMREKLYYDILEASRVPTARSSYVRLFINGEPQGLYLMADTYKNPFTKKTFGQDNSEYKHGALFQGVMQENPMATGKLQLGANLGYLGSREEDYLEPGTQLSTYKLQEPAGNDTSLMPLVNFISFIESTKTWSGTTQELEQKWNEIFDVPVFLKKQYSSFSTALELLLGHNDGYLGAAHNYLLYQDPAQDGRLVWLPSDLDQTMGSTLVSGKDSEDVENILNTIDQFGLLRNMTRRPLVLQLLAVETFKKSFYQILSDYHHYLFETDAIANHVFYLKQFIQSDVTWDQSLPRIERFQSNTSLFLDELEQKILQLPLGKDFYERIDKIDFVTAIQGRIVGHPSITSLIDFFEAANQAASQFSGRIIAQIVISLGSVVTRAFVAAYKQAAANAAKNGGNPASGGGRTGTKEAVLDALTRKSGLSMEEACQILNVTKEADLTKITKSYEHLFNANDPGKGGSFYIQSKVVRAKERIEMERVQELKEKAAEEAAEAAAKEATAKEAAAKEATAREAAKEADKHSPPS
ncbi:coth protein-domain-containing protein [Sporodiniella umbellata]|nr:coth protein-domain-containing protein [Sporodiniella umbellata]